MLTKSVVCVGMPDKIAQTVLAFDFGMKRIGVAVGQTITTVANPLPVLSAKDGIPQWQQVQDLIDTWQANLLIVGQPLNMDGSDQFITNAAKRFGNRLKHRFNLPVEHVDERLTTIAAREWAYADKSRRAISIDSIAAKLILEAWLEQHQ